MILNKSMKTSIKEIKELDKKLNELYKYFKKDINQGRKLGMAIPEKVLISFKNLVFSIDNYQAYEIINENKDIITAAIPDKSGKFNLINDKLFLRFIDVIKEEFGKKNDLSLCEDLFDCLENIENISKSYGAYNGQLLTNEIESLIDLIKTSENETRGKVAIYLLKNIDKVGSVDLITRMIIIISKNNPTSLKQLYIILKCITTCNTSNKEASKEYIRIINLFLDYIKIGDKEYSDTLTKIIEKIFDVNVFMYHEKFNLSFIEYILDINTRFYKNDNIIEIIYLLEKDFLLYENDAIKRLMISNILEMNFINDNHRAEYLMLLHNTILKCNNEKLQIGLLNRMNNIKNMTVYNYLEDWVPIVDKYVRNGATEEVISEIIDIGDYMNNEVSVKTKSLTMPIDCSVKED